MAVVGLIGVGLVGTAMAERLLAAGHQVVGYDLDARAAQRLVALGGHARDSAIAVARECDEVLLSLPSSREVREVLAECDGAIRAGQLWIDTSTGSPDEVRQCSQTCAARGAAYVDATILGSSESVRRAEAVIMLGGEGENVARAEAIAAHFSARRFHVGQCGRASELKLVVNLVLGLNRAALAEGLAFARHLGFDLPLALDVLCSGAAYSRAMDAKGAKMISGDFKPEARLAQHHKDVRLILAEAARLGIDLPLSATHQQLLEKAEQAGFAAADNSAIIEAYVQRSKGYNEDSSNAHRN